MKTQRWKSIDAMVQHMVIRQEWMPIKEAADLYRVTDETMQMWIRTGKFAGRYFGDELWIARGELLHALRRQPGGQEASV